MNKLLLAIFLAHTMLGFAAQAGQYRDCVKNESKKSVGTLNCDFSKLNLARSSALNKCGPLLLEELMGNPNLKIGSDDFKSSLDNQKRSANGDIEELAQKEAKRCGVELKMEDNHVTVSSPRSAK
jgi:hypothetical protein